MASGDIVFEADNLEVDRLLSGYFPSGPGNYSTPVQDGWTVSLNGDGGRTVLGELFHTASPAPSVPFDKSKTYDVIIKEH
jgi:hypothetical protein